MSSYSGTQDTGTGNDISLQLAPVGDSGPNPADLSAGFEKAVRDCQSYVDQCRLNFQTRYALWNGQSADGKKHAREGAVIDPTPWDGASDLRVYLNDNVINKKVAMMCMAVRRANLVAMPIEGNTIKRAAEVTSFMRWLIRTQIPGLDREEELLAQYLNEKGLACTGQFWEVKQEKQLKRIRLADFQAQVPGIDVQYLFLSGVEDDRIKSVFEEVYGCSRTKAGKMLKELKATGETTCAIVGKQHSYPVIRAFNCDNEVFFPPWATDIETCPAIYRVQYFSPEQLRGFVNTDDWDPVWVEKAIKTCRGQILTISPGQYQQPLSRSFVYTQQRFTDLIGVVYGYRRLSDEDGVPGIYLTIFNPRLGATKDELGEQPGYAKDGLFSDNGGEYPFVLHRREYLSRKIYDSRGIPEPGKPWQDQIKAHQDSRIDAASIRIMPPLFYPLGRPPVKWGAGARIPERRPGEYHYGEGPAADTVTDDSEDRLKASFNDYNGLRSRDDDPMLSPLENQFETDKYLSGWSKAYRQVFNLYKRFGSEQVAFRVIGVQQADPTIFDKGDDDSEQFNFYMTFDVQSQDFKRMTEKITAMVQTAQLDRDGSVNWAQVMQIVMESIDPNWAERVLQPASVGTKQVIDEVQGDLAKLSAGVNVNLRPNTPPQIAMQALQNYVQGAPDVQQRLQGDKPFADRLQAYAKQIQMIQMQQQNAVTGRLGAAMPGPVIGGAQ